MDRGGSTYSVRTNGPSIRTTEASTSRKNKPSPGSSLDFLLTSVGTARASIEYSREMRDAIPDFNSLSYQDVSFLGSA